MNRLQYILTIIAIVSLTYAVIAYKLGGSIIYVDDTGQCIGVASTQGQHSCDNLPITNFKTHTYSDTAFTRQYMK